MDSRVELDKYISLAHGNDGRFMRELIEEVFARHLGNESLDVDADAVSLAAEGERIVFTTDGFTVQPLEFPGGDIGSLAVHGTTNDLAVSGAVPRYLSLNAFIEEGFEIQTLDRIVHSLSQAARDIGVRVVAGDTKVLRRGEGGGLYLATTGIGFSTGRQLSMSDIRSGDVLLVSGPVGDHGIAVMLARETFGMRGDIRSDAGSVLQQTRTAMEFDGLRFMRDPTRGGLATVCTEMMRATSIGLRLEESAIPVRDAVHSVCDMLGYDPLYLACEGRVVAVIAEDQADELLHRWRAIDSSQQAAIIGRFDDALNHVVIRTAIGGERVLDELEDDPLPRIC